MPQSKRWPGNRRAIAALAAAGPVLLAGCSLAPAYQRPTAPVAESWKEIPAGWQEAGAKVPPAGKWWEVFGEVTLDGLEDKLESGNPSLAAAVARYDQARAVARAERGALLPEVDAGASIQRNRESVNREFSSGTTRPYTESTVGASLSYELDLFGRVRNTVKAAQAEAQASASDLAGVRLGLQAALATAYFDMRGLDARIVLLRQTVDAYTKASDLTNTRHEGGVVSGVDVSRADAQLASAKSELDAVLADRANLEHAIAILLGESPSSFSLPVVDGQASPPPLAAGLPSALLERRPDIAAAEQRVKEANFRIGIARSALFPQLTLGTSGGFLSTGAALFSTPSSYWALGPAMLAQTLFDGGARSARVRQSRAAFTEAAATYRGTVLTAFREVEDDLASQRQLARQEQNQQDAANAATHTLDLSMIRYRDGAADYLEVVTAQTAALDAERSLLQVRTRRLEVATDLVRALGGKF